MSEGWGEGWIEVKTKILKAAGKLGVSRVSWECPKHGKHETEKEKVEKKKSCEESGKI